MRIATFNVQNLRLRRGPQGPLLDGARDGDGEIRARDTADRRRTAEVIAALDADVLCLQEVYDLASLDHFHDAFLRPLGAGPWPHRVCLPGNDGHGRDIAVMSRRALSDVASHATLTATDLDLVAAEPDRPVFCRDCLRVRVGPLTLFAVHFKAPWPDPVAARAARAVEAQAVRRLVERRFAGDPEALWLILGDVNEPAVEEGVRAIAPLAAPFAVDLLERLAPAARWTYRLPGVGTPSRPDAMMASPALARRWPDARPEIHRAGLPDPQDGGPRASDHAAVVLDLPGL